MGVELGSVDRVHQPHLLVVVDLDEKSELDKWPGLNLQVGRDRQTVGLTLT